MRASLVISVVVFLAVGASTETASSNDNSATVWEFVLAPFDLPARSDDFSPRFEPETLMAQDGPTELVAESGEWIVRTKPLSEWLTRATLSFTVSASSITNSKIGVALPLAGGRKKLRFPAAGNSNYAEILAAYKDETLLDSEEEWLYYYLRAEAFIASYVGAERSTRVFLRPELVRALIVYSTALSQLVKETSWFAPPSSWSDRRALLERIERVLKGTDTVDRLSSGEVSSVRVSRSVENLREIENHLFGRIFRAFVTLREADEKSARLKGVELRCHVVFPAAYKFYKHLNEIQLTDKPLYDAIKQASRFTRTHVLNEVVSCFRLLLTRVDGGLVAMNVVVLGEFGGRDAISMTKELLFYVRLSLEEMGCQMRQCSDGEQALFQQTMGSRNFLEEALPALERDRIPDSVYSEERGGTTERGAG